MFRLHRNDLRQKYVTTGQRRWNWRLPPGWRGPKVSDVTLLGVFTGVDAWSNVIDSKDWDCGRLGKGVA